MKYFVQAENRDHQALRFCVRALSFDNAIDKADAFIDRHHPSFVRKTMGVRLDGKEYGIPSHWPAVTVVKGGSVVA